MSNTYNAGNRFTSGNTFRAGNTHTSGNTYNSGNAYSAGNAYTPGNAYNAGNSANASASQVPGEAEFNRYANTQFSNNDPWESARLLHRAVAKGYPPAIAENKLIRRDEILGCMFGAMLYAPFFGLLIFIGLCFILMWLNPPIPFEPDMLTVYAIIVYILVPVIYTIQKKGSAWL